MMSTELDPLAVLVDGALEHIVKREHVSRKERKRARIEFQQLGWRMVHDLRDENFQDEEGNLATVPLQYFHKGKEYKVRVMGYINEEMDKDGVQGMESVIGIFIEDVEKEVKSPVITVEESVLVVGFQEFGRRVYQRHYSGKPASYAQIQEGIAALKILNIKLSLIKAFPVSQPNLNLQ